MNTLTYNLDSANTLTTGQAAVVGAGLGTLITVGLIIGVLLIIAGWKIFEKAGEKGWKIFIPFYNTFILFRICGIEKWFWAFLGICIISSIMMAVDTPSTTTVVAGDIWTYSYTDAIDLTGHTAYIIGMVISCIVAIVTEIAVAIKLAKGFGKGVGYTLGLIFLPNIFTLILGFGKAKYSAKNLEK